MFKCSLANCILRLTTAYLKFGVHFKKKNKQYRIPWNEDTSILNP